MAVVPLLVNGERVSVEVDPKTPLLWVLRDTLGLTGTKFGCGIAMCGACTVLVEGEALRSCATPVEQVRDKRITTVEGLGSGSLHPLQRAWIDEQVPQCGYCQPGMLMAAAELLSKKPKPTDADIDQALAGHICRCGTYLRIRRAIHRAAAGARTKASSTPAGGVPGGGAR